MINIIITILALMVALLILIFYCDSVMDYKESAIKSHFIAVIGYLIYCVVCLFGIGILNIICGIVINFLIMYLGYEIKLGRLIFRVAMLTAFMMCGEMIASLIIKKQMVDGISYSMVLIDNLVFTITGKLLYFIFVVIFRNISVQKNNNYRSMETMWLITLPISTCIFLSLFNQLHILLAPDTKRLFIIVGIMLIISTFIVYVVCERIVDKNIRIQYLQSLEYKREMDEKSFQLIKEKYEELRIMAHDFNKYCNNIEGMLSQEQCEALTMIQNIKNKSKEFMVVEYTNNSALNVLLSQKMKECNEEQIDFQLYAKDIDLSFINEMDTVAIFANLIDNAIESCRISDTKKIFFSINIMNSSYIVIRVDNSADTEPIVVDNHLITIKQNKEKHGIGLSSIQKSLVKYGGNMRWSYDKDAHTFTTTILINILEKQAKI